jgi:hypothetical protein
MQLKEIKTISGSLEKHKIFYEAQCTSKSAVV